jgi:hypothetical protein
MNKDRWEKDTDARRWRRCIEDRRGGIITSFPMAIVAIRPIITPAMVAVIPTSSVLVTATVIISAEGRQHVYTANH